MWQSLRRQISTIRGIFSEFAPLVKHAAYPALGFTQPTRGALLSASATSAAIPTALYSTSTSAESIKIDASPIASSAPSFRLVTGYYGLSKEVFYGKSPNFDKTKTTYGDDSWFVTSHKNIDVLGVADGVGGWREMGIDPSKFSSSLMQQCKRIVEQDLIYPKTTLSKSEADAAVSNSTSSSDQIGERTPIDILVESYQSLRESKDPSLIGSSTACIVVFNRESRLVHTANLGDSGFVIVRDNKIVHRSQEQCHYFNAPYQLAIVPTLPGMAENEMSSFNDSPQSASSSTFELLEGDFVVLGTDGLWDNLSEGLLLLKIANIKSYSLEDLQRAAHDIVNFAAELARDPEYFSPFALSARKNGYEFRGGKPDDITLLLARVTKS